ncbi:MAG: bifunctional DNA-formamidopyrimidine glycosylase/DNA-(apurinic or apyrimidinic site) lyase [Dehalococcoidia bacterium]
MPELPDVEVFRRYLDKTALHQTIEKVEVFAQDILDEVSPKRLQSQTEGCQLDFTDRRGKYLFTRISDDGWLVFHFGMTGYFSYFKDSKQAPKHTRVLFSFENGHHLAFVLQRKLGSISATQDMDSFVKRQGLGPDALDKNFDVEAFKKALKETKSSIKSALMDQERIAGIGNIYSDEILFQARLNPKARANQMSNQDLDRLFQAMKEVLKTAIDSEADPEKMPEHYLLPHRGKGARCPACHGEIDETKVSGRSAYFCPGCQSHQG